ncbi:MAG: ABC transporter substrate-binding protein [Promethearchaeota archaeon]
MKTNRILFIAGFILFNLLVLNTNVKAFNNQPKSARDENWPLNVGTTSLGNELDPAFAWDADSINVISQVWEGLFTYDENTNIIPRLATNLGIWNSKGDQFNVTLRSGVIFHNGNEFNATSVKYTFDRIYNLCVNQNSQIRELYFPFGFNTAEMNASIGYGYIINETVVIDNTHVSFKLNFPYIPFQALLCFSGSFIVDPNTAPFDTYITFDDIFLGKTVGTGPYKFLAYSPGNYIYFEANSAYYRGSPLIKYVDFLKYPSSTSVSSALLVGDLDFALRIDNDFMNDFQEYWNTIVEDPIEISTIYYLGMNNAIIGREYRQAISYAVDCQYIIHEIYDDTLTQMTSIIPNNMLYHKDCSVPYLNIGQARQILINAGLSDPLDQFSTDQEWIDLAHSQTPLLNLSYQYNLGNVIREDIGVLLKDNLAKIGINVYLEGITWGDFLDKLFNHHEELNLYSIGWMADYNDPSDFINPLLSNTSKSNSFQVNDTWIQAKMGDGLKESNDAIRQQIYFDMQDYIATDLMPFVFLGYGLHTDVHSTYLENYQSNAMNTISFFECSWADDTSDWDGDGIPNFNENNQYSTNPNEWDTDFDGIGDYDEIYTYNTNPNEWDTDFDGIGDYDEINTYNTNPNNDDSDNDGLSDGEEINTFNTNPNIQDSDGDGLNDHDEVLKYNTDPNKKDSDGDGYTDKEEVNAGSDPNDINSTPENITKNTTNTLDPFANIPGYPLISLFIIFIFLSFGLVFFMKKKFRN